MHHGWGLREILRTEAADESLVESLVAGYEKAALSDSDRAMLDYALKLTRSPEAMEREDVEALREHGFDDRSIHDICAVTAYFAFVNRIADGLGVALEPFHAEDPLS